MRGLAIITTLFACATLQAQVSQETMKAISTPDKSAKTVKTALKIYPYAPGGYGTIIASSLAGENRLGQLQRTATHVSHEGSDRVMNTIPSADYSYFGMLDKAVQAEPVEALAPRSGRSEVTNNV